MEPPEIAVEVLGGDAAEAAQEALDLAVAAVDRLDVQGSADPLAGGAVDALMRDVEYNNLAEQASDGVITLEMRASRDHSFQGEWKWPTAKWFSLPIRPEIQP